MKQKNQHQRNWQSSFSQLKQANLAVMEGLDRFIEELELGKENWILLLEVCTGLESGFWPVHRARYRSYRIFVFQVTKKDNMVKCGKRLYRRIVGLRYQYSFLMVTHFSPPCTGGSPAQHLVSEGKAERLAAYEAEFEVLLIIF